MIFFFRTAGAIAAMALAGVAPAATMPTAVPAPAAEQPARSLPEANAVAATAALKPGEFRWDDTVPSDGPMLIQVSIADQKLYAWRNGALFAVSTVSTGRPGHATPTGAFPILEKHREHRSNRYADAPMPFMQRLTGDGVALHAGRLPGYPASHGCVRLPLAFAERLFAVTSRGSMVLITSRPLTDLPLDLSSSARDGAWPLSWELSFAMTGKGVGEPLIPLSTPLDALGHDRASRSGE